MSVPAGFWQDNLKRFFSLPDFRSLQESVVETVGRGESALVVMPTGAGKSLCYQLPTLALNTRTLVVSPLLSLIQDQIGKLKAKGFRAEGIYSGLDRETLRQNCIDYRDKKINFLFVSPERLTQENFFEFLLKHKPDFIAVDEAHCISLWGHDFRPDYRTLGEKLQRFESVPVLAMTATATKGVQEDILEQLKIPRRNLFISGFWRSNIEISLAEKTVSQRTESTLNFLRKSYQGPTILYTASRKKTHEVADFLQQELKQSVAAYHAGLDMSERTRVQELFLAGKIDIIVATVAFGMGIDKPDVRNVVHLNLPNSLESYYQEIGRAGRDGKFSAARLFHSRADLRTQRFIIERSYPHIMMLKEVLAKIFSLSAQGPAATYERLKATLFYDDDVLTQILSQLRIHRAMTVESFSFYPRDDERWEMNYIRQRKQRLDQIDLSLNFVETSQCRMAFLTSYFGDTQTKRQKCGLCDNCKDTRSSSEKLATKIEKTARRRRKGRLHG